ncbi:M23 family metallopeptidase [Amylibacter sp.]|nr:M23 family metallopeptidase [Amylibacter sp.]
MDLSRWFVGGISLFLALPAWAELELRQPLDCSLGETCLIQQFMDHDATDGVQDFSCDGASYDGHKGTDFRVSVEDMGKGVDVLAAADGVIMGLRNDMADQRVESQAQNDAVAGKECGNGLVLRHEDGWETQYCHMKQSSVIGKKGARVKAGDVIGQVGLSGRTQFAHLHLSVRKNGKPVDPFASEFDGTTCGFATADTLWSDDFASAFVYQPTKIAQIGLADTGPSLADVMDGRWIEFALKADAPLVVYGLVVNGKAGDQMVLRLNGPNGAIVSSKRPSLEKRKAQWFGFAGKRAPSGGWPRGGYTLSVEVLRSGKILHQQSETAILD